MEAKEVVLDSMKLENGLTVYFINGSSRPVAGRCQVRLVIRVPIEPAEEHFLSCEDPAYALGRFLSLAGPGPVEFETVKVRNFVAQDRVDDALKEMKDDFVESALNYLSKPSFAANFLVKSYGELCKKAAVQRAHREVLRKIDGK